MFIVRSLFWLTTLTFLLPPSADGQPPPRVSVVEAAYAARVLVQDVTGVCGRNPEACATSRETLTLMRQRLETGAGIVAAGLAIQGVNIDGADHGTLRPADLEPEWVLVDPGAPPAD